MMRHLVPLLGLLLAMALLAGCLGGDDDPQVDTEGEEDNDDQTTGVVRGRVLTLELKEVVNARVTLAEDGEMVEEALTDENGNYEIRGVEPGAYLLQFNAACCKQDVRSIQVEAGEAVETDVQLEPFSDNELQVPFIEEYEWTGFMSCGFVVVVLAGDACSDVDDASDRTHPFEIEPGLKTLTATLVWSSPGLAGDRLQYGLAQDPCDDGTTCSTPSDYYGYNSGESPVDLRIDEGEGNGGQSWEDIEETTNVQLRVFPEFGNANVFYQEEFTVYYHLHYHQKAPEGYDPTPDL